jgi:tetratricopeptide (TPR) repeat protein
MKTPARPSVERVALLPVENLSSDTSLDWIANTLPALVASECATAPKLRAVRVDSERTVSEIRPTEILRAYFTGATGKFVLKGELFDAVTNRSLQPITVEAADVFQLAAGLARQFTASPREAPTKSDAALRSFGEGELGKAIEADPAFGLAYVTLAQQQLGSGDAAGFQRTLAQSKEHAGQIPEVERAELDMLAGQASGNPAGTIQAMAKLAELMPSDAENARRVAESALQLHQLPAAVDWFKKAAAIDPENAAYHNALGYSQAYIGDYTGAIASMEEYAKRTPGANPLDSLGEVYFFAGRFSDAEQRFQQGFQKEPAFQGGIELYKVAFSRLMTGDVAQADQMFNRYLDMLSNDPLRGIRKANWDYFAGRRKQAIESLKKIAERTPGSPVESERNARAGAQAAMWLIQAGEREQARALAQRAVSTPATPGTAAVAGVCLYLSDSPATAGEWAQRAERLFAGPQLAGMKLLAYSTALLLDRHYPEAAANLEKVYAPSNPNNWDQARVMLGGALLESGKSKEAEELLRNFPLPPQLGENPFVGMIFPHVLEWKAQLAERAGQAEVASRYREAYRKLSGDLPDRPNK